MYTVAVIYKTRGPTTFNLRLHSRYIVLVTCGTYNSLSYSEVLPQDLPRQLVSTAAAIYECKVVRRFPI